MISLSDRDLATVMTAARVLTPERRDIFLQRVAAMLKLRGRFNDNDAAAQDHSEAVKNRDMIERHMTPAQIAEAQKLAREWKPTKQ